MNDSADTSWVSWVDDVPQFAGVSPVKGWALSVRLYRRVLEMSYTSRLFAIAVCLFVCLAVTAPVWAQAGSPTIYFSTGNMTSPSQIYSIDSSGTATPITLSSSPAPLARDYEGLVVLPDDTGTYPYLVYACDTAGDQIIRFSPPSNGTATAQVIYSGSGLYPQCGRGASLGTYQAASGLTASGDLIVTSTVKGNKGGLWEFKAIANVALGDPVPAASAATQLFSLPANTMSVYEGIAMKNIGDLLIVDKGGNQVLQSPGPISTQFSGGNSYTKILPTPFITGLSGPMGIARATTGEVFVANQSSGNVTKFDAQGQNPKLCVSFNGNYAPYFMQMGLDNTLYVGATKNSKGEILEIDANQGGTQCTVTNSFSPGVPVVGIALPPTSATATAASLTPPPGTETNVCPTGATCYSFTLGNSAVFDVATGGSCPASTPESATYPYATATETSPSTISGFIGDIQAGLTPLPKGGTPAVDLWADAFEIVFDAHFSQCLPVGGAGGSYEETLSNFVDPSVVTSGTVAYCDGSTCQTVQLVGTYPYGGLLPEDYSGSGRTNSQFFVINATPSQTGQFCGYQSPFSSTNKAPYNPLPPYIAGVFSTGSTISVKFKLATALGSCKNGPYIPGAVALISIAQLCTPGSASPDLICSLNSQMPLVPSNLIALEPEGNSTPTPPIYKFGNNQYQFSLSLKGYPPGLYSLTTTFDTGETTNQTILFQVQ